MSLMGYIRSTPVKKTDCNIWIERIEQVNAQRPERTVASDVEKNRSPVDPGTLTAQITTIRSARSGISLMFSSGRVSGLIRSRGMGSRFQ